MEEVVQILGGNLDIPENFKATEPGVNVVKRLFSSSLMPRTNEALSPTRWQNQSQTQAAAF